MSENITREAVKEFPCCHAVDLGEIYNLAPDYVADNTCQQCTYHTITYDENGEPQCEAEYSSPPHRCQCGPDGCPEPPWIQRGARLLILLGATIVDGTLSYQSRKLFYSRHRRAFPYIDINSYGCFIGNPIWCDAQNEMYECCGARQFGGPGRNCTFTPVYNDQGGCISLTKNCGGDKPQEFKFPFSPCEIEWEECDEEGNCVDVTGFLMGYADAPQDWWFLEDDAYQTWVDQIAGIDPFGQTPHTIYAHFEMDAQPLDCCTTSGAPQCGGTGDINLTTSKNPCGGGSETRRHYLSDEELRVKSVRITAAVGFTIEKCGYDPQEACDKTYEEE